MRSRLGNRALADDLRRPHRLARQLRLRHDVDRPAARLAQDAADVFPDDAEHEQLPGAEDGDRRHHRGPAGDGARDPQETHDGIDQQQEPDQREGERKIDGEPQRLDAVSDDAAHGEVDHASQRELRAARGPRALRVGYLGEREAEPAHEAAQKYVAVLEAVDRVDGGAIEQQKVGAAGLDRNVADEREHAIEQARSKPLAGGDRAVDLHALGDHHLGAEPPLLDQQRHDFGRVLEVAVHEHDRFAACVVQPRAQCRLVAEVARERDVADGVMPRRECPDLGKRVVGRAVVDEHDFMAAELRRHLGERRRHRGDVLPLVVGGQHEGNLGPARVHEVPIAYRAGLGRVALPLLCPARLRC